MLNSCISSSQRLSLCAEEHVARLNAEGQAADSERRLQVAQEQVAEFAHQREEEASTLLRQLGVALTGLHPDSNPATLKLFQVCEGALLAQMHTQRAHSTSLKCLPTLGRHVQFCRPIYTSYHWFCNI